MLHYVTRSGIVTPSQRVLHFLHCNSQFLRKLLAISMCQAIPSTDRICAETGAWLLIARRQALFVLVLLAIQAGLLGYSATRHSPTHLEPAFLASGIANWQLGRFELYCANPPLVRMVAAVPVLAIGFKADWSAFNDAPRSRSEYAVGSDFLRANGPASVPLFIYARFACIPFSLIGSVYAYRWAFSLYGPTAALVAMILVAFDPNLLAHGELITPDTACTSFGIMAGFYFWNWLKKPSWGTSIFAGLALGLALISKFSSILLVPLWPCLWFFWRLRPASKTALQSNGKSEAANLCRSTPGFHSASKDAAQLATMFFIAIYIVNCVYSFDESFKPLKEFAFVSTALTGGSTPKTLGNRFRDTIVGDFPVPVPALYLTGLDLQNSDFEQYHRKSYLRGEWKQGGGGGGTITYTDCW